MRAADYLIEVGPGGGRNGGTIVATGTPEQIAQSTTSLTGSCLRKTHHASINLSPRTPLGFLTFNDLTRNNLKHLDVSIPLGVMTALTGVSGSGKSSLVDEIVSRQQEKMIVVDQQQIGKNMRGCIATYVGAFDHIRKLVASANHVQAYLFSFNSRGACSKCKGIGAQVIDMNFLGDITVPCDQCGGRRYCDKALTYLYCEHNIADILDLTVAEARQFFESSPPICEPLTTLDTVGLGYITLGQSLSSLSGGESQRLKLASRLQQQGQFYILDEPTSGLHPADVEKLMTLLNTLVDHRNTVLVVEHNLDVIRQADWIIDLGPEGGERGGHIVAEGTPERVSQSTKSITGQYLFAEV
jgi:excinuclease UvrABC ATPase subunit